MLWIVFTPAVFAGDGVVLKEQKSPYFGLTQLRDDMNRRFDLVDKKFEAVDKRLTGIDQRLSSVDQKLSSMDQRFESMDKRFDFMQNLVYVVIGLLFGSPFLIEFMARKRSEKDHDVSDKTEKLIISLNEVARKDSRLARALKLTGLLK